MSRRGRKFFDEWIDANFTGFNPPKLQLGTDKNTSYLLADAKQAGIEPHEIESEVGGDVRQAVFEAIMKALEPSKGA